VIIEIEHGHGVIVVDLQRPKPNYAFVIVSTADRSKVEALLQCSHISWAKRQLSDVELERCQRREQSNSRQVPLHQQPQLAVLQLRGLTQSACNATILGLFRQYGPFVDIKRHTFTAATITLIDSNANALLEDSHGGTIAWPCLHIVLDRDASPTDSFVLIHGCKVCRAYLFGHCHGCLCPWGHSHPLYDENVDYNALLSHSALHKRKSDDISDESPQADTTVVEPILSHVRQGSISGARRSNSVEASSAEASRITSWQTEDDIPTTSSGTTVVDTGASIYESASNSVLVPHSSSSDASLEVSGLSSPPLSSHDGSSRSSYSPRAEEDKSSVAPSRTQPSSLPAEASIVTFSPSNSSSNNRKRKTVSEETTSEQQHDPKRRRV
jgi:hypothetical protein